MTGSESKDVRLFDIRVVERNIKKGLITRKDQEQFLRTLPDATDKVAEATEYVPGLTAAEMNEAALASSPMSMSHHVSAPAAHVSADADGEGADLAASDDDDEAEGDDEDDTDGDADTDTGEDLPPSAA
jgi:hypothetical protein